MTTDRAILPANDETGYPRRATGWRNQTGQHPHRRCLTGAVRPKKAEHLPLRYLQRQPLHSQGLLETLGQIFGFNHLQNS